MNRILSTLILALAAFTSFAASAAVDVNKASQAELEAVKGIGPGLAGRILEARGKAPFGHWADMIERVRGLGAGNAARLSEAGLTVGGATFTAAAPAERPARQGGKARTGEQATTRP
jgi:competence protein ComEA